MANTILMANDYMERIGVTVTGAGVASASMAVTNVLTPQPSEFCRFDDESDAYLVFSGIGSASTVDYPPVLSDVDVPVAVFVGYTNCVNSNTIRIRAAVDEANLTANPDYDSGEIAFINDPSKTSGYYAREFPRGRHHLTYLPAGTFSEASGATWWRIDILGGSVEDYIDVGVVSIGRPFVAGNPIGNGWSFGSSSMWIGQTSMGGQKYRRSVASPNTLEANFQMTTEDEAFALHNLIRNRGEAKPMLCVIAPGDDTKLMNLSAWGFMSATSPIAVPYYGLWQTTIRVEEMP